MKKDVKGNWYKNTMVKSLIEEGYSKVSAREIARKKLINMRRCGFELYPELKLY